MGSAAPPDIHRVELDSGYVVGTVNAWLVEGEPFTLVDAGSLLPGAVERLEGACGRIGRRVEDIDQVVLSHHHVDHLGLAAHVAEHAEATVTALAAAATYVEDFEAQMALDGEFAGAVLEAHGFGAQLAQEVRSDYAAEAGWAQAVQIDRRIAPGDVVDIGAGTFTAVHRPGHSETDTVLIDARRGVVFSGDHLMRDHASMPMIDRPLGVRDDYAREVERCDRLVHYRRSLTESLTDIDGLVLPGHGDSFDGPRGVIAHHLAYHDGQAEQVLGAFAQDEPATARAIAERLWPRTALQWPFLSACTILGVLGWLEADRRVERTAAEDGRVRYRSA